VDVAATVPLLWHGLTNKNVAFAQWSADGVWLGKYPMLVASVTDHLTISIAAVVYKGASFIHLFELKGHQLASSPKKLLGS
jgi:hypothetical protein